jgi:O-acetyl-ADP-ribose deacetylase (regulator of RNase III)
VITYIKKDLTTVSMGIVCHGVNCQGKMASGVAKAIRATWPKVYEEFMKHPTGAAALGQCQLVQVGEALLVANLFTQQFYGYGGGRYASQDAIRLALDRCGLYAEMYSLPIYMPKIGCGLGGLSWEGDVKQIVEEMSSKHAIDIYVCELEKQDGDGNK